MQLHLQLHTCEYMLMPQNKANATSYLQSPAEYHLTEAGINADFTFLVRGFWCVREQMAS